MLLNLFHNSFDAVEERRLQGNTDFVPTLWVATREARTADRVRDALASLKSYRPKDEDGPPGGGGRNPDVDFHGEKRRRDTHLAQPFRLGHVPPPPRPAVLTLPLRS